MGKEHPASLIESMMMGMEFFFNNSSSSPTAVGASESLPTPGESRAALSTWIHNISAPFMVMADPPGHPRSPPGMSSGCLYRAPLPKPRVGQSGSDPAAGSASLTSPEASSALHSGRTASSSNASAVAVAHNKDYELQRKRARDRRSQQAMRDRNKSAIQTLTQQVSQLSAALNEQACAASTLGDRVKQLEGENAHLRAEKRTAVPAGAATADAPATPTNTIITASTPAGGAFASSLATHHHQPYQVRRQPYQETQSMYMTEVTWPGPAHYSDFLLSTNCLKRWELPPFNLPHACIADEIVLGFIARERQSCQATPSPLPAQAQQPLASSLTNVSSAITPSSPPDPLPPLSASSPLMPSLSRPEPLTQLSAAIGTTNRTRRRTQAKPDPAGLIYRDHQSGDEISNMVGGIIRSYIEIETLPKQVSVFYTMTVLVKWLVSLDAAAWETLPAWLRPLPCQLQTPHAAWVDRIPWPRARRWLVSHPEITLDIFAATYSSSLTILWDFSHEHVLVKVEDDGPTFKGKVVLNPIFEQHIRQLKYWTVSEPFRTKFAELAKLIEQDRRDWK